MSFRTIVAAMGIVRSTRRYQGSPRFSRPEQSGQCQGGEFPTSRFPLQTLTNHRFRLFHNTYRMNCSSSTDTLMMESPQHIGFCSSGQRVGSRFRPWPTNGSENLMEQVRSIRKAFAPEYPRNYIKYSRKPTFLGQRLNVRNGQEPSPASYELVCQIP